MFARMSQTASLEPTAKSICSMNCPPIGQQACQNYQFVPVNGELHTRMHFIRSDGDDKFAPQRSPWPIVYEVCVKSSVVFRLVSGYMIYTPTRAEYLSTAKIISFLALNNFTVCTSERDHHGSEHQCFCFRRTIG